MSVNPSVAMNAVRAPRPSSSALVATVIPWENSATALASAPARSSTARTAARTPSDWSSGVVGALAVIRRPSTASTASVKVPPTSTPRSITAPYRAHGDAIRGLAQASPTIQPAYAAIAAAISSVSARC